MKHRFPWFDGGRAPLACVMIPVALLLLFARDADAQAERPLVRVGAGLSLDLLVGDASDFIDGGSGPLGVAAVRIDEGDHLRLRIEGSWIALEEDTDALAGGTADNGVLVLTGGPQLVAHIGPVRPAVSLQAGLLTVFRSAEAGTIEENGATTGLVWGGTAGLGIEFGSDAHPVELFAETRVLDSGERQFARAPAVGGSGSPVGVIRADFGVLSVRVGLTVGL